LVENLPNHVKDDDFFFGWISALKMDWYVPPKRRSHTDYRRCIPEDGNIPVSLYSLQFWVRNCMFYFHYKGAVYQRFPNMQLSESVPMNICYVRFVTCPLNGQRFFFKHFQWWKRRKECFPKLYYHFSVREDSLRVPSSVPILLGIHNYCEECRLLGCYAVWLL
jgi:hypothetical protein